MDINFIRSLFQWASLIGANMYLGFLKTKQVYQGSLKGACIPILNCHSCPSAFFSCPIGTIQHFMTLHKIPFTVLGLLAAIGISIGAMACGWLCPFGLIQDLFYKLKSFKIGIPKYLTKLRYFVLFFLVFFIPYITQETWFSKLCPMGTLQAGLPWAAWNPIMPVYNEPVVSQASLGFFFAVKVLILLLFLGLFVIAKRPFCRTICPLGAIFGIFNRFSLVKLTVDTHNCKGCDSCVEGCPVDINVGDDPGASTCVRCLKCLKCEHVHVSVGSMKKNKLPVSNGNKKS